MSNHTLGDSHFLELTDGRKLHYRMQGTGTPTVVFESGMGFSGSYWGLVQPAVAKETTAVVYDRAGSGQSDWDDAERSLDRISDDLAQLLDTLPGPFILVGHSWGGPIVRKLTTRRSHDVVGLVLVDQSDERDPDYFIRFKSTQPNPVQRTTRLLMHTVGLRLAAVRLLQNMPADCKREVIGGDLARSGLKVGNAEFDHFIPDLRELLADPDIYPGIDVTLISGTKMSRLEREFRPGLVKAHQETAAAVEKGKWVEAPASGHYPPITEPDLVVQEILALVHKNRR